MIEHRPKVNLIKENKKGIAGERVIFSVQPNPDFVRAVMNEDIEARRATAPVLKLPKNNAYRMPPDGVD